MPGAKQAWPIVAACWSPAMPRTGTATPSRPASVMPNSAAQSRTSGRTARGMLNRRSNSSSHAPRRMSNSMVRAALVASVACTRPPVSRQSRKQSTVPKASVPRSAAARAPAMLSSSQASLVAEKYGSASNPVRAVSSASAPSARSLSQCPAVRRSCQTMARCRQRPVARSHSSVVSRWLVMPMPATRRASPPACSNASRSVASAPCQMSSASCSTQPGAGKCCGSSTCAVPRGASAASKAMVRVLVVPWSSASSRPLVMVRRSSRPHPTGGTEPLASRTGTGAR